MQRCLMEAFTIGAKGYIGTGNNPNTGAYNDFWEYDPVSDTWTQKANVPPVPRLRGVGFAANGKGYIGLGSSPTTSTMLNDLWEYDPASNSWTQKANFPSWGRFFGVGFAVGTIGYVGLGADVNANTYASDLWAYNPAINAWTQRANFPGGLRLGASSFVVGNRAYVGTGTDTLGNSYADLWEYNPANNSWLARTPLPAVGRSMGLGITIFNRGYFGTGIDSLGNYLDDWYEFNPATNSWATMANFPNGGRFHMVGFGINCRGYVGTGHWGQSPAVWFEDWWEFIPPTYHFAGIQPVGSASICPGSSVVLQGTGGVSYVWSTGSTASSITVSPTTNTTYTVTASTGAPLGCTSTATLTVYMNQIQLNTSVTAINCSAANGAANVSVVGNGTPPYSYLWTPTNQTGPFATGLMPMGHYTVHVTDATGCTGISTCTIVALNAPNPVVQGNTTLCAGDATTLSVTGGTTYLWNTGTTATSIVIAPTTTTNYSVVAVTGLCSDSVLVPVYVFPRPVPVITNDLTLCQGTTATLTATGGNAPYFYQWNTGSTQTSLVVTPTTSTTYSVLITIGTCKDSADVTVTPIPSPTATISGNTTLCTGDITTLTGSGVGSYSWSSGQTTPVIITAPPQSTTYTLTVDNGFCRHDTSILVNVFPPPVAAITGKPDICIGDSANLQASGGVYYLWSTGSTSAVIHPTTAGNYSVVVTLGTCKDSTNINLVVHPLPVVIASDDVTIVQGQTANISASGADTYVWAQAGLGAQQYVSPQYSQNYCVTGIDSWGCMDTACVMVHVISCETAGELFLPNAFSPNGDGENDELQIYFGLFDCIKTFRLSIYNRWGERVYFTTDPFFKWNGQHNRGMLEGLDQLPGNEVLVFKMEALLGNEELISRTGNITIFR